MRQALVGLVLAVSSCAAPCGTGTVEIAGQCVAAIDAGRSACCGPGTHWSEAGCVLDYPPHQCDPWTDPYLGPDGLLHCPPPSHVGCGLACPAPGPGNVSVCGRMIDAESGAAIAIPSSSGLCDLDTPEPGGPCALSVRFYPALEFASDPDNTPPLVPGELRIDQCGNFAAMDIEEPSLGFLAVVIDDHPALGSLDDHVASAVFLPATAGLRRPGLTLYAVRTATDAQWTTSAADPFGGETFAGRGAVLSTFLHDGQPVAGVTMTVDSAQQPDDDFYFADSNPWTRSQIDPALDATGANGSALVVGSSLVQHSGTGGEPAGCAWPSDLATSLPDTIVVRELEAEAGGGETCP